MGGGGGAMENKLAVNRLTMNLVFTLTCLQQKSTLIFCNISGYEDDIFEVISNLRHQESKFCGNIYKFGGKSKTS